MKLGPARGSTPREDRSFQLRRDRGAAPALRVMFPTVERLCLELRFESAAVNTPVPQTHVLHPPARAYFAFPCPYADCDGRFDLTTAVHLAVERPSGRTEGLLECTGSRACGLASKRPCQLHLHFTVTATLPPAA
jgi:hypothetical protein